MLKGKLAYMAPEQARGDSIDGRADVFSVGVMLWEAAVGHRMWSKEATDMRILHALLRGEIPRPSGAKVDIDPELERMILKATAARASDRYASAAEFQADLENHLRWLAEPTFGARDIHRILSEAFAEERAAIKAVVDEHVRSAPVENAQGNSEQPLFSRVSARSLPVATDDPPQQASLGGATQTYCSSLGKLAEGYPESSQNARLRPSLATRLLVTAIAAALAVAGGTWAARWYRAGSTGLPAAAGSAASLAPASSATAPADATGTTASAAPAAQAPAQSTAAQEAHAPAVPPAAWRKRVGPPPAPHVVASGNASALAAGPTAAQPETASAPAPAPPAAEPASGHVKQQIDTHDPYAN
jgi:serine/threonine-protein kinase